MILGRLHHDDLAELAAQAHNIVRETQFTQVEGGGQASGVIVLNVDGYMTVPFGSTLGTGHLIRCEREKESLIIWTISKLGGIVDRPCNLLSFCVETVCVAGSKTMALPLRWLGGGYDSATVIREKKRAASRRISMKCAS